MDLSELSIKRPIFMSMLLVSLILFGSIAFRDLGVDLYPKVDFPVVALISTLPSADPETVETQVTEPIEEALSGLDSVKAVRSITAEGVSHITVEFQLEKDVNLAYQDVQAKLGAIRNELPIDLQGPIIEKFDMSSLPVLTLLVSSEMPPDALNRIIDKEIKQKLKKIPSIGQITIAGKRDSKIWLWLDKDKMEGRKVTIQDVQNALGAQHIDARIGKISHDAEDLLLTTKAEFTHLDQIADMVIVERGGMRTLFRDIGRIERGLEEEKSIAKMNGVPAIALLIGKQSGANTVDLAKRLKEEVVKIRKEVEPKGVKLEISQDNSLFIERSVHEMHFHLFFGGLLAVFIVLIFLRNVRSTLVCSLALPTAVIGTFAFMAWFGFTQNMMTLLALSIAIGLLIDDAIVVQDNIMRHVELGLTPHQAAIIGTREITLAVVATTLSIVAVFVPVAFMKGIVGQFFFQFGLTVSFAVLISMFVSFTLNPLFSARLLQQPKNGKIYNALERAFHFLENGYARVLRVALHYKKSVILLAIASFTLAIFVSKFLRFEFLPPEDQSQFAVNVETKEGSSFQHTAEVLQKVEDRIRHFPWIQYVFSTVGGDVFHGSNKGAIYVKMTDKDARTLSQFTAMSEVRASLHELQEEATISIEQVQAMSGGEKITDIQFEIRGPSLSVLQELSTQAIRSLESKGGYIDIASSLKEGKPQAAIHIKREAASEAGVTPLSIAMVLKAAVGGIDVIKFREDGERIDVALKFEERFRENLADILQIQVKNMRGENIPLSRLATIDAESGPARIDRCNQTRQVTVYANLRRSEKVLGEAIQEINQIFSEIKMPPGYSFCFAGNAESFKESFGHLLFALMLAVILVYMVLAAQFESLLHPFTIMLTLPLSIVGAVGALVFAQMTMSIFTMIGIIMLMGLVTKNGILLIDCIQQLKSTHKRDEAIVIAGMKRLRPILMTTLAVIFGMLPVALSRGEGSESRAPMAVAVIGGLITSTILTLVIIPVVYALVDSLQQKNQNFVLTSLGWIKRKSLKLMKLTSSS